MDMKNVLLKSYLDEELYMEQPKSFIFFENENKVCKLVKFFYG